MIIKESGTLYEAWVSRFDGSRLAPLTSFASFDYTDVLNDMGRFNLTIPLELVTRDLLKKDYFISFYRQAAGSALALDFRGLLSHWEYFDTASGDTMMTASGYGMNGLLRRRIIYAKPGTAQAAKTAAADNMMKAYVRENLGSSAGARAISSTYFSVEADESLGVSLTLDQSNVNLLTALQTIAGNALTAGSEIYFNIEPTSLGTFEFKTYKDQIGEDHTTVAAKVLFAKELGNLANPRLVLDYDKEVNFLISWGGGHNYKTASDSTRIGLSPFALTEDFWGQTNLIVGTQVQAGVNAELARRRPTVKLTASVIDTPTARYGVHWKFGDRVSANYGGYQFRSLIRSRTVAVDPNGKELIKAGLEGTITL